MSIPGVEASEIELRERLAAILRAMPPLMQVLSVAHHLNLPDWLVFSGAVYQPVLNHMTGRPLDYEIKDYDLGYFDASDLSYDAEDAVIRRVKAAFDEPLRSMVEVSNQARVHLWFETRFGEAYGPLSCTAEVLERLASATFAVGVRLESGDRLHIEAPFGLADLFALRVRPNPRRKTVGFARTAADVQRRWPEVEIDDRPLAEPPQSPRTLTSREHQKIDPESPSMSTVPIKFRQANPVDKEAIQRISANAYIPAYMAVLGTIPKPATEDYGPRIDRGEVWILEIKGEPTGIAVLEEKADHLLVYSIAVKPDAQQKGYGTALLDFADQRAIGLGLRELRLYTNERMERNLRLYCRHGFAEVGKRPHPSRPGQVLIDMVRQLKPPTSKVEQD
jgi:ribosomal protein S18 acetylase RimI-like enzyme